MSIYALLASACAPLMFQGVEIDGPVYPDGSYGANPTCDESLAVNARQIGVKSTADLRGK